MGIARKTNISYLLFICRNKKNALFYSNYNELDLKNDIYFYNLTSTLKKAEILLQEFQKQYKKLKALHFNYTQRHKLNRRNLEKENNKNNNQ